MSDSDVQRRFQHWEILNIYNGRKTRNIGNQIRRKELTKTFMMISNWKNHFGLHGFYKKIQLCKGLWRNYASQLTWDEIWWMWARKCEPRNHSSGSCLARSRLLYQSYYPARCLCYILYSTFKYFFYVALGSPTSYTVRSFHVGFMLGQRCRRWPNIDQT